jgi:hypothetical protein
MAAVLTAVAAGQIVAMAATAAVPVAQPTQLDVHVTVVPLREADPRDSTARLGGAKIQLTILL